jgi:hypothetical protein
MGIKQGMCVLLLVALFGGGRVVTYMFFLGVMDEMLGGDM